MVRGRAIGTGIGVLAVLLLAAVFFIGARLEGFLNRVQPVPLPAVSEAARRLHASSTVVDMHADSLLMERDLLVRSAVGHVDLPRLQEGGVGLQFFTVVTKVPLGLNIERNDGNRPDLLTLGGVARLSAMATRGLFDRAMLQAEHLNDFVARSHGQLVPVRTVAELDRLLERRARDPNVVGALLGIEGAQALEGDPDRLEPLFAAGFRMIGLTHFFDTEFAGSAHGLVRGGLTDKGRRLVRRMEQLGVLVDLAHLAPQAVDEVLATVTKPTVFSHGGVRGTCDNTRNLTDAHVRAIARGGGVIGIGYWETAACGLAPRQIVAAMRYVVALVGDDHVGLGSDFDGATTTGFDTSALPALTQEMLDQGLSETAIRKILGGNAIRVLRQVLPPGET